MRDDQVANKLEALNGTLKAAKRQKKVSSLHGFCIMRGEANALLSQVSYDAELLLSPTHDNVEVVIL